MIDPFYVTDSQFYEITKMNFESATAAMQATSMLVTDFGDEMHTSQYVSNIPKLRWYNFVVTISRCLRPNLFNGDILQMLVSNAHVKKTSNHQHLKSVTNIICRQQHRGSRESHFDILGLIRLKLDSDDKFDHWLLDNNK